MEEMVACIYSWNFFSFSSFTKRSLVIVCQRVDSADCAHFYNAQCGGISVKEARD